MLRRMAIGVGTTAAMLLWMAAIGSTAGAASPPQLQLVMPQATAFSILGHDCGGITEYAYVTGFDNSVDPSAGYPTGYIRLSTRCSSGKGGPGTTYTAWTADTWDLTGALLTDSVYAGTPSLDSGFSATDPLTGNQISNSPSPCPGTGGTGSTAYACLQWAATFTPRPRVTGIATTVGPATGGTSVTIYGDGFTAATGVDFGGSAATSFTVNSDNSITAASPADTSGTNPDTVDVRVVSPGGTSFTTSNDQFTSYIQPKITGVSPNHGGIYGGYYVTVSGANFIGTTAVMAGDTSTAWQVIDNTTMSVYIPASDSGIGDSISISVTSPGGTSPNTPAGTFTYTAPASVALTPRKGLPGTRVKARGANFITGEKVTVTYLTGLSSPKPAEVTICTATTKASGAFVCKGKIPAKGNAGRKGSHEIDATGSAGDHASTFFTRRRLAVRQRTARRSRGLK
jgi:IPT/TIG domain